MFARLLKLRKKKRPTPYRNHPPVVVEQLEDRMVPAAFLIESATIGPAVTDWTSVNVGPVNLFNPDRKSTRLNSSH